MCTLLYKMWLKKITDERHRIALETEQHKPDELDFASFLLALSLYFCWFFFSPFQPFCNGVCWQNCYVYNYYECVGAQGHCVRIDLSNGNVNVIYIHLYGFMLCVGCLRLLFFLFFFIILHHR